MDKSRRNFLKSLLFGAVAAPVLGVMKAPEANVLKNQGEANVLEIKPKPVNRAKSPNRIADLAVSYACTSGYVPYAFMEFPKVGTIKLPNV